MMSSVSGLRVTGAQERIRGFDGLRAIAFIFVFANHKALSPFTDRLGATGVWLFLVLSGFLMVRILWATRGAIEEGRLSAWRELSAFYIRRAARIVPAYYVLLAVAILLGWLGYTNVVGIREITAELLFLSNIYIERTGWHNELGHLWTLAVEQQFYLLVGPLAIFLPQRVLPSLCLATIAVSVITFGWLLSRNVWLYPSSLVNFGALAFGGWVGLQNRELPTALRGNWALLVSGCLILAPALLIHQEDQFVLLGRLSMIPAALLLIQIAQAQRSGVVALLEIPVLRWIGSVSYCAYLIHPLVHVDRIVALMGMNVGLSHGIHLAADLALTLAVSAASGLFLERQALGIGRRAASQLSTPPAKAGHTSVRANRL